LVPDKNIYAVLKKTIVWFAISLLFSFATVLTVAFVKDSSGVVGFDCSINSFCLLMMLNPVKTSYLNLKNKEGSEFLLSETKSSGSVRLSEMGSSINVGVAELPYY